MMSFQAIINRKVRMFSPITSLNTSIFRWPEEMQGTIT